MERKLLLVLVGFLLGILGIAMVLKDILGFPLHSSVLLSIALVLLAFMLWFIQWALQPMGQDGRVDINSIDQDILINVKKNRYYMTPSKSICACGVIFYPGGRVTPLAYLPLLIPVVKAGYSVYLVKMPLNMAVFDYRRAEKIMAEKQEIKSWILGGHSLGGAMIIHAVLKMRKPVDGLFIWGSYPSRRDDLSRVAFPILSIYGSCDGITTEEKIENSKPLFPQHTQWVRLDGANHAQFGCYGVEKNDFPAKMEAVVQRTKVVEATIKFLEQINR